MKKFSIKLLATVSLVITVTVAGTPLVGQAAPEVVAWGENGNGQTTVPSGLSNVVAIAAAESHSLALTAEGRVVAWGGNWRGQTDVPSELINVVAIAAGNAHSLALTVEGRVVYWGSYDQASFPYGLSNVVAIAAGDYHSLALTAEGRVVAWGSYYHGNDWVPMTVPSGLSNVVAIAAGLCHSLALIGSPPNEAVPAWVGPRFLMAVVNQPFHHRIIVKNGADIYGAAGLPPGLALDPNTGLITGLPAQAGTYPVVLSATNSVGSCAWTVTLFVNKLAAPRIASAGLVPAGLGSGLTYEVVAYNAPEWYGASGLPEGLVVDSQTGLISGVPVELGDFVVSLVASNRSGLGTGSLTIRVSPVVAWGSYWNNDGEWVPRTVPSGLSNVVAVAAGGGHNLALVGGGSPTLSVQPFNHSVILSNTASLTALAVGSPPLSCQWQFNGINVAGATNTTLELVNVQLNQAGNYTMVVSNMLGDVTSRVAQLTVLAPPSLNPLPVSQTVAVGADMTFTVKASGTPPFQYQWRKNGVNIPGATNDTLTITNVQVADGGSYSVVVANVVAAVTSDPVLLVVEVASQAPPEDNFVNRRGIVGPNGFVSGTNKLATVESGEPRHAGKAGGKSVWYSWQAPTNGIATFRTSGSAFDTLLGVYTGTNVAQLTPVANDEDRGGYLTSQVRFNAIAGQAYAIAVDGFAGAEGEFVLAWELDVTVDELPVIARQPTSLTAIPGSDVTFTVQALGQGLTYQWLFNDVPISGATSNQLELTNVQADQVGLYTVRITNPAGRMVESLTAALELASRAHPVSRDKWQDIVLGVSEASGTTTSSTHASGLADSFLLVSAGTIDAHILNNWTNTTSAGEPSVSGVIGGASTWLGLRPAEDGVLVVDTLDSAIETVLAVYTLTNVIDLQLVASDKSSAVDGVHSRVRIAVRGGKDYLVMVDGETEAKGRINLNWALGQPPVVESAFTNQVMQCGDALALSVGVSKANPPAVCQWWVNDQPIAGATNTMLALTNLQGADSGFYRVVVSNAIEVVERWVAQVEVPVPELTIRLAESPVTPAGLGSRPGWIVIEWPLHLTGYVLEATDTLSPPLWTTNVAVLNLGESPQRRQVAVDPANQTRFFRLRKP